MAQVKVYHKKTGKNDHETPKGVFDFYDQTYSFKLDAGATKESTKCKRYITEEQNALKVCWKKAGNLKAGDVVFLNPAFDIIREYVEKIKEETRKHRIFVFMLVSARVDSRWFFDLEDRVQEIRFIKGRLCYDGMEAGAGFPTCGLLIGSRNYPQPVIHFDILTPQQRGFSRKDRTMKGKKVVKKVAKKVVKASAKAAPKKSASKKGKASKKAPMFGDQY